MAAKKPRSPKTKPKKPSKEAVAKYSALRKKKTTGVRGVYRRGLARLALGTRRARKSINRGTKKTAIWMFSRKHRWSRRAVGAAAVGTAAYGVYRHVKKGKQ